MRALPKDATVTRSEVLQGRLLTPGGMPAEGVQVKLDGFYNDTTGEGMSGGPCAANQCSPLRRWMIWSQRSA